LRRAASDPRARCSTTVSYRQLRTERCNDEVGRNVIERRQCPTFALTEAPVSDVEAENAWLRRELASAKLSYCRYADDFVNWH